MHPLAFAVFPILSLYSNNLGLIPLSDLIRPLGTALAVSVLFYALCAALLRRWDSAAIIASVGALEFFTFDYAWKGFQALGISWMAKDATAFVKVWIPLAILILIPLGWKWRHRQALTTFFNVAALVLTLFPIFSIVTGLIKIKNDLSKASLQTSATGKAVGDLPDIYYVILDGYGRQDALQHYFGFDNSPFIAQLQKRGFYVAPKSRSNYCQTELSLASSLNMNFVNELVGDIKQDSFDRAPLDKLLDQSKVAAYLKSKGYQYVAITSGFPGVHPSSADILLTQSVGASLFESTLLDKTPLQGSPSTIASAYDTRRLNLMSAYENFARLGQKGPRPRFVFIHILAPHPPFVFGPKGESVRPKHTTFGFWDASAFFAVGGTQQEYHDGYSQQIQYVNTMTLGAVDRVLAQSSNRPIIILQGDHGSRAHLSQDSLASSDVRECFRNLNAYLVPPSVRNELYPSITPVNSFRVIFDALFKAGLPRLPDRSYYTTWSHPYEPTDVTEAVERPL